MLSQSSQNRLYVPEPPWTVFDLLEEDEKLTTPAHRYGATVRNVCIRRLRGSKMTDIQGLMDEFGAAFQFFEGFGENWYALKDCLIYLDDYIQADAYIALVTEPQKVLEDEEPEQLHWLRVTFEEVGEWWSKPIEDNQNYNRPAIPFHFVLQCERRHLDEARGRFVDVPLLDELK